MWCAVYAPVLLAGSFFPARDLAATHLPWRTVWANQVRSGVAPLWDPASNQGRLLLANPNTMAAYPGTLLFALLPPETAEVLHIALHHLLFIVGLYALCRRTGASPGGAAVAAATVGGGGVAWSAATFLNVLAALSVSPWVLAVVAANPQDSAVARRRAVGSGVLLGVVFLAGEPVLAGLAALTWAACVASRWQRRLWSWALLAVPAAAAVAAPVLVPLLWNYADTVRGALGVPPGALGADTLAPRRLLEIVLPNVLGAPMGDAGSGFWAAASFPWQRYYPTVFVGSLTFVLLPSAWAARRSLATWWLVLASAFGLAFALGFRPFAALVESVPGAASMRFAIKLLVPGSMALAPLLAAGWDRLAAQPRGWRARAMPAGVVVVAVLIAAAAGPLQPQWRAVLGSLYPASAGDLGEVPRGELSAMLLHDSVALGVPALAVLVSGPLPSVSAAAALAAGALAARGVLLSDSAEAWATPPEALQRRAREDTVLAVTVSRASPAHAPARPELRRFWEARAALVAGYATRFGAGYVLARGPDGLEPLRQEVLASRSAGLPPIERARLARALGANTFVSEHSLDGWEGTWVDGVWVGDAGDTAQYYLAERLLPAESLEAATQFMITENFRPGGDAVIEGSGGAREPGGGTVVRLPDTPHRRRFRTESNGPGFLVVQQSYLAAWRATVDGRRAVVEPANWAVLGVPVPAGSHVVEVFLEPLPYRLGACGPLLLLVTVSVLRAAGAWRGRRGASGGAVHSTPATRLAQ